MQSQGVYRRIQALEQRVAGLEQPRRGTWQATAPAGGPRVEYGGRLSEPEELEWSVAVDPEWVFGVDDGPRADVLSALGHPARVALVRLLARGGAQNAPAVQAAVGLGSTGRFYHHLKILTVCGVVEQDKRGSYRLRAEATIPVLVLLAAASDVAGQMHHEQ